MDSGPGRCWVCDAPGKLWCSGCRFALYCSLACQKKDKARHLDECFNSSRRRFHCSYCGRDEILGGVPCSECLVCSYCTDSCRKIDAKNHRPICQKAKEKVLQATKKIGDWNRRAKGIPQYMGRLIHAVDYLRWAENEGSTSSESFKNKKRAEEEPQRDYQGRRPVPGEGMASEEEETTLRLLLLGADLKHILRTLHETPDFCTQGIDITMLDSSPHILARNLLVLYLLMLPDAPTPLQDQAMLKTHAERIVMVFYSLCLDMETHALLCNTLHNLLNMTYKSFLHEMRQQVYVDAVSYTLVQAVWSGWMSYANDPSAMQKLEKVRTLKMSGKVVKDILSRYVKSCPKDHQKAVSDWIKRGSLKKQKGCHFPNVTLTCFSPLKKEHLDRFDDVSPKWSEETEWIKAVSPEDDMIYAPHGIDMVFQDWDFALVSKYIKKESNVIEMYLKFLTQVFKRASQKLLKSNRISFRFIRANIRDLRKSHSLLHGKFDRIATGIHADLLGTPFVLQELGNFLRNDNAHARLLTHHRVWSLCLNWQLDQQAREMCQKCVKGNKPPDHILLLSARWSTFRHFLQAELLHHLHIIDGRPVELDNILPFREVAHAYDMILSDYTHHLNQIVPFRFRPEKRMVSMVDSRLHTLEWRRVGKSRRISVPAAAHPKPLPDTQTPDVDPASRYVHNLISLSRSSPVPSPRSPTFTHSRNSQAPSPTNSDSCPSSRLCSRDCSLSPCPTDNPTYKEDRSSRSRLTNRPRPRSLYVSTRCRSPLLSSEFDFWEQQNLMKDKKNKAKTIHCTEIPEGIKNRAQMSLETELKQAKARAKSAPASPQTKCKQRMVKEKATVFERGSTARSTFPETRKHLDAITPSTPVKKLVMMFSKAFTAREKDPELIKPLKRSNSFHGRRASFEQGDQLGPQPEEHTYSLRTNKPRNAIESGMCTLPRKSRPYSIAVSKFSYLEGCIDKKIEAINNASREAQEKEKKKKKEFKKPTTLNLTDSYYSKKDHISPIRSLIAGLNPLSVSPVLPRTPKQQKKTLKETISIKRDELRRVNLRPGSSVSSTATFDGIKAMDWPESHLSFDKYAPKKTQSDSPKKTPSESLRKTTPSPRKTTSSPITPAGSPVTFRSATQRRSPCHSPTSTLPRMFSNLRKSLRKIPHEPEYVAPPLYVSKSPNIMLHSSYSDHIEGHQHQMDSQFDQYVDPITPTINDESNQNRPEEIFSPKSSPFNSHENRNYQQSKEADQLKKGQHSGSMVQTVRSDIENRSLTEVEGAPDAGSSNSKDTKICRDTSPQKEKVKLNGSGDAASKKDEIISPEDLMAMTSASMSVSLSEADQEVSEIFSHEESFAPIKPKRSRRSKDDDLSHQEDNKSPLSNNDYMVSKEEKHSGCSTSTTAEHVFSFAKSLIDEEDVNSPIITDNSNPERIQIPADTQSSSKSPSPQIIEQGPAPVYKIVERFVQRIQAEQQLIERPASPKTINVMKKNSQIESGIEASANEKEKIEEVEDDKSKSKPKVLQEAENPITPNRANSPEAKSKSDVKSTLKKDKEDSVEQSPKDERIITTKIDTYKGNAEENMKATFCQTSNVLNTNLQVISNPKQSVSLRSSPVNELLTTPVNKMVEKFALQIEAQSHPPSPMTSRPNSIGTLIQQDFLRLYSENLHVDEFKPEDDIQENLSLLSDCCEETMFEISEDEEQRTGDIAIGVEKHLQSKSETKSKGHITNVSEKEKNKKIQLIGEDRPEVPSTLPPQPKDTKLRREALLKTQENTDSMNRKDSLSPSELRLDELRYDFLQRIRGISDSPIPFSKKKYGEIKATLSKKKHDILQGEKIFADEINNSRAVTSSPQLEDMAIVSYTIKVDTDSITEQLRTTPIIPSDDPGGAIGLVADRESHGLDGDSQELCSNEYKEVEEILANSSSRTSSPVQYSPRFNTLPMKSTSSHMESLTSSLKRITGKKKIPATDISQHKVQMLKSSRTGGMDKMSFRHFVKTSITNEDSKDENQDTSVVDNADLVIEYASSVDMSVEEFESNPDVEEALEAFSLTSEDDDKPIKLRKKKFTLYSDDSFSSDNSVNEFRQSPSVKRSPSVVVRRKRLPTSQSPTDLKCRDQMAPYASSPKLGSKQNSDDSDNDDGIPENVKKSKGSGKSNAGTKSLKQMEHLCRSPLGMNYSDDARQSPDSIGLNFNVEIPDTPLDSNRDIRRFMWGSLKKKIYSSYKSKKDHKEIEYLQSGSDAMDTKSTADKCKGPTHNPLPEIKNNLSEDPMSKKLLDSSVTESKANKKTPEASKKDSTTMNKHKESPHELLPERKKHLSEEDLQSSKLLDSPVTESETNKMMQESSKKNTTVSDKNEGPADTLIPESKKSLSDEDLQSNVLFNSAVTESKANTNIPEAPMNTTTLDKHNKPAHKVTPERMKNLSEEDLQNNKLLASPVTESKTTEIMQESSKKNTTVSDKHEEPAHKFIPERKNNLSNEDLRSSEVLDSPVTESETNKMAPEASNKISTTSNKQNGSAHKFLTERKKNSSEEDLLSNELLDCPVTGSMMNKKTPEDSKKKSTTPTIVAMVPKNKGGSPIVGLRLSRESKKSYPRPLSPKALPKPAKRDRTERATGSEENIASIEKSPYSEGWDQTQIQYISVQRPKSWSGAETLERPEIQMGLELHWDDFDGASSPQVREAFADTSWSDENEVFLEDPPPNSNTLKQETPEEKVVEVRPRAGVLKNGRDRSRDSRRTLRVSWGDLPERMDSPSASVDDDGECQQQQQEENEESERQQESDYPHEEDQGNDDDIASSSTTQL